MNERTDPTAEPLPAAKPRLLLVENEPSLLTLLGEMFRPDYELLVAADGYGAWEIIQGGFFDLVLMDVLMPGLDGIELTRRLRSQAHTANVPILLLSGCNKLATLLRGLDAGADDFMLKPFRPQELLARLRNKLKLSKMRLLTSRMP